MSNFFDKIHQKLFKNVNNPNIPFIEERLERSLNYQENYAKRIENGAIMHELQRIRRAYELHQINLSSDLKIHVFNSAGSNGIAVDYDASFGEKDFLYLFDYLKDRVEMLGYRHHSSHRVIYLKKEYAKTLEKHYLKPPLSYQTESEILKYDQQYGNILIEHILKDDKSIRIRLLINYYSGYNYTEYLDFNELLEMLWKEN